MNKIKKTIVTIVLILAFITALSNMKLEQEKKELEIENNRLKNEIMEVRYGNKRI